MESAMDIAKRGIEAEAQIDILASTGHDPDEAQDAALEVLAEQSREAVRQLGRTPAKTVDQLLSKVRLLCTVIGDDSRADGEHALAQSILKDLGGQARIFA